MEPNGGITTTDVAIYLGIYASVVSTAAALWALFSGVFRDRARITVKPFEAYLVSTPNGQMIIKGEDTLQTMGVQPSQRSEVLAIRLRNRGRRDAHVEAVSKARWGGSYVFGDLVGQVPCELPAERQKTVVLGAMGGYGHGDISTRRFFVVDGADRVHPLRERYRQRLASILYKRAVGVYFKRKRRRLRRGQE